MNARDDRAAHYRERARQLLTIAASMSDKKSRETITSVAKDYERMAQSAESLDRERAPSSTRRRP